MKKTNFVFLISLLITSINTFSQSINELFGYWPFNGNANGEYDNNLDGTIYGATLTADRNGNPNNAYSFDGIDDYITMGNCLSSISEERTLSFWFKTNDNSKIQGLISYSGDSTYGYIGIEPF